MNTICSGIGTCQCVGAMGHGAEPIARGYQVPAQQRHRQPAQPDLDIRLTYRPYKGSVAPNLDDKGAKVNVATAICHVRRGRSVRFRDAEISGMYR